MRHSFFRLAGLGAVALSVSIPFAAFADEAPPEVPVETHFNLTVIKQVVQHEGGSAVASDFAIRISGGDGSYSNTFAGSESGVTDTHVPLGTYSVSEAPQTGFEASYSEGCNGTADTDGEDVTCTVTNTELPATLTVTKVVVNDDGGEASVEDFPLYVGETSVSSGEENEFDPGTYTVSEENETDYVGTFSGDCDSQGHITLTAGQNATCTITNDDPEPPPTTGTLIVKKHVVNDNQGTKGAGDFTIRVYRPGRELTLGAFHLAISAPTTEYEFTSFEGSEEGTPVVMSPGDYRVQEDETDGYTASYSGDCEGSIAAGETKTCEITNDDAGTASNGKGGLGSGDSIPGDPPTYQTSGGSGSGSNGSGSGSDSGSGTGSSDQGGTTTPPAGRVLGDEEVNTTLGACVLDEADAALIVPDADQMTAMQHLVRNLGLESRYRSLVQGVLPRDAQADAREAAIITHSSHNNAHCICSCMFCN
jgi:hypothetical protein